MWAAAELGWAEQGGVWIGLVVISGGKGKGRYGESEQGGAGAGDSVLGQCKQRAKDIS